MAMRPSAEFTYHSVDEIKVELPYGNVHWLTVYFTDTDGLRHVINLWPNASRKALTVSFELDGQEIAYTPGMFSKPESPELKGPDVPQPGPQEDPLD